MCSALLMNSKVCRHPWGYRGRCSAESLLDSAAWNRSDQEKAADLENRSTLHGQCSRGLPVESVDLLCAEVLGDKDRVVWRQCKPGAGKHPGSQSRACSQTRGISCIADANTRDGWNFFEAVIKVNISTVVRPFAEVSLHGRQLLPLPDLEIKDLPTQAACLPGVSSNRDDKWRFEDLQTVFAQLAGLEVGFENPEGNSFLRVGRFHRFAGDL